MPTVLDLAGVAVPSDLAGRSLAPLLRSGKAVALPQSFVVESELRRARKIGVYEGDWLFVENRDGHPGTSRIELQQADGACDGAATNQADGEPERAKALAESLTRWEEAHPRRDPTPPAKPVDEATQNQLRALGYVD
jgi:hypothetical protein